MPYVVTDACIKCKFMDCVEVCPTHAFHEGPNAVVINPSDCANCALCEMVCPVLAIVPRAGLPLGLSDYAELNARLAKQWPKITTKGIVPADAEQWVDVANKGPLLEGL